MIEVLGFEESHGRPCAVFMLTEFTSGKRKYQTLGRAVRVEQGWWLPIGRSPSERWFESGMQAIQRAYGLAIAAGLARHLPEAAS